MQKEKKNNADCEMFLDNILSGIVLIDAETLKIEYANPYALILFGREKTELIGKNCNECFCSTENCECPVLKNGLDIDSSEKEVIGKNGKLIPVIKSVKRVNVDGKEKFLESFIDISGKKRAEDALAQSETLFRQLTENAKDIIFRLRISDGVVEYVSPSVTDILGYTPQDFYEKPFFIKNIIHPAWHKAFYEQYESLKNGIAKGNYEMQVVDKRGSIHWISQRNAPIYENGRISALEGIITDITERKQTEEKLRESEELYKAAFMTSPDAINIISVDGVFIDINEGFTNLTGYKREDVLGVSSLKISIWAIPEEREKLIKGLSEKGYVENLEFIFKCKNGEMKTGLMSARLININNEMHVLSITRDISERKRAAEALKKSEENYKNIFNNAAEGIFQSTPDGKFLKVNPSFVRMMGYTTEEDMIDTIKNIRLQFYANHEDRAEFIDILEKKNEIINYELEALKKNKEKIWISINAKRIRDKDDKTLYYEGTIEDITIRKKGEEEIQRLNDELTERVEKRTEELVAANKELESFAYSVSHDLRAPLRHINSFSELLVMDLGSGIKEASSRYLNMIINASKKMGDLIDNLLSFSRLGRSEINKRNIDVEKTIDEAVELYSQELIGRNIKWVIGEKMPYIYGDIFMIRQAVINLVGNAIKYSRNTEKALIEIDCKIINQEIIFSIKDNGVGFDMKYAHKLFGVFQRLHTEKDFEGTGIGLALVKRIIARHNGRVWAEGETGKGAAFYFSVPSEENV